MASLTSQTVASSYTKILITDSNDGLSGTASNIEDGDGTASPLYLSTSRLGIGQSTPATTLDISGDLSVTSTSALAGTVSIGGGYGSTGITLSDAGVIQANGAMTVDGASTLTGAITASSTAAIAGTTTIGGGYGSTGVTLTDAGVVQMNGALTVDGASTLTGAVTASSTMAVAGALTVGGDIDFNSGTLNLSSQTVNVGLYAAVDSLNFDSNTLSIDAANNRVGIGTAAPDMDLEIEKTSANVTLKINAVTAANDAQIQLATGDDPDWLLQVDGSAANDPLHFYDYSTSSKVLTLNNGKVGIGTETPSENLHISGDGERGILVTSTDNDSVLELASDTDQGQNSKLIFSSGTSASKATILYDHHDTPASAKMQFLVGDNAVTATTIRGDGKIGINTTDPESLITIQKATSTVWANTSVLSEYNLTCRNNNATVGAYAGIAFDVSTDPGNVDAIGAAIVAERESGAGTTGTEHHCNLAFMTNDNANDGLARRMTILSNGFVGIGEASPSEKLHIKGSTTACKVLLEQYDDTAADPPQLVFARNGHANDTGNTAVGDNDELGKISFQGYNSNGSTYEEGAYILGRISGTPAGESTDMPTELEFATCPDNSATPLPRMNILPNGFVGIGTTSPDRRLHIEGETGDASMGFSVGSTGTATFCLGIDNSDGDKFKIHSDNDIVDASDFTIDTAGNVGIGTNSPGTTLDVNGAVFASSGVYFQSITANNLMTHSSGGDGTNAVFIGDEQITTSSDMRIKKNIVDTESNGLDVINKFRVVDFNWDDPDDAIGAKNKRGTWTGFLAQEAVKVAPYSINAPRSKEDNKVDYESEQQWFVNYGHLVPVLTKAIQELSAKVEALENA